MFLPADSGAYEISGAFEALVTSEGAKKNPLRIGIDMGGTSIKIGVVNEKNEIIARTVLETRPGYRSGRAHCQYGKSDQKASGEF